ncbi:MAG: DUF5916 domain-containing protein [Gemmatimonadales bacterium]
MLPLLLVLLQSPQTPADPAPDPGAVFSGLARQLDVTAPRIELSAHVDGALDEPVWSQAARLTGFSQYRPVDGRPAADSTEILVWYAPDAVWFGIRAFEAHGAVVRATLADRDNISADDYVEILLDTYNDRRRALVFAVNALGVQQDGVRSEGLAGAAGGQNAGFRFDGVVDLNPDYVYQSRGRVTPSGYEIEVRIPFKSLRYQSRATQDWGLQVVRTSQHSGYEDTWTPVVRANASFLIQAGRLVGLTDLRRGLVMDVTPELTARMDGAPQPQGYDYASADPELGGTLRWGITQNLSLGATANPDFSQVEADVGQVTLNERFALFFPEKRPFFLEGLEQFDTPNQLIYMRRVADPVAGAKLTGKMGGTGVGYLLAVDASEQSVTGSNPVFNLLRLRRDLGTSSTAGLTYTDRIDGGHYNRVLGSDVRLIWKKIWFSDAQVVGSWTRDAGGTRTGALWNVTLYDRTGRSYGNHAELVGVSPEFEARSGFVNRTNVVHGRLFNRFSWYGQPGAWLEQATTFIGLEPTWRYDDFFRLASTLEAQANETWLLTLRGGWGVNVNYQVAQFRFTASDYGGYQVDSAGTLVPFVLPHGLYGLWGASIGANTPNRALTLSAQAGYGATPLFAEAAEGRGHDVFFAASWKPTAALRLEGRWAYRRLTRASDGSWFSTESIPRLKLEYQLTRDIFFRYVGQYVVQEGAALEDPGSGDPLVIDGQPAVGFTFVDFRNDVLFSYKPIPGTVFFLGYGASLTEDDPFAFRDLSRTQDGFFLKASYLFRM